MQPLKITLGRKQRRWYFILAAAMPLLSVIIAVWFGLMAKMAWVGLGIGVCLAVFFLYYCAGLATSYTECTREHIRTRRLSLPRETLWTDVRDIAAQHTSTGRGTSYYVRITTTVGKTYYLGGFAASYSTGGSGDEGFPGQLQQVVDYWHAADAAQAVTG